MENKEIEKKDNKLNIILTIIMIITLIVSISVIFFSNKKEEEPPVAENELVDIIYTEGTEMISFKNGNSVRSVFSIKNTNTEPINTNFEIEIDKNF